uniref:Uncharacterized protein n=1 Tax=Plectus sambesii TaxID=2011161 RepID=A0A914VQA5_9BILA
MNQLRLDRSLSSPEEQSMPIEQMNGEVTLDDDVPVLPLPSAGPEEESDDDRAFTSENATPPSITATLPVTAESTTLAADVPPPRRSPRPTKGVQLSRYVP